MEQHRELTILNKISEALNGSVDLEGSLQTVLAQVADLLEMNTSWIFLFDEETKGPYLAGALNLPPGLANNPHLMGGWCYCLETYVAGNLDGAANVNVITCSRLKKLVDGTDGLRYHSSIPLYAQDKKLGVLNVASSDWRKLSEDDLHLLHTIGDLLSIAIERSRLFEHSVHIGAIEERNRLSREIHDTLAQGLAAIALQLETADALLETGAEPERISQALKGSLSLTRKNLEEARRSVLDLRALPLEGRSLGEALGLLGDEFSQKGDLSIDVEIVGGERSLSLRIEMGMYRIAQEALNNVVQHANAKKVRLQLTIMPQRVNLTIEDDGDGFDPAKITRNRYGIIGINERAKLLGGTLTLKSDHGKGTQIEVDLPLID